MTTSLFPEYVKQYLPNLVVSLTQLYNDKANQDAAYSYLFRERLVPAYSPDGKWTSISSNYKNVAADVVALGSKLPLKKREALSVASGDIPKLGMALSLDEQQMKNIENMSATLAQGNTNILNNLVDEIFQNVPRVYRAVNERIEDIFLTGLSTGVALAHRNVGTGIRLNYGYKAENQFGVTVDWATDSVNSKPLDDLDKLFDKASEDGSRITDLWVDNKWLRAFGRSEQVRGAYATIAGVSAAGNGVARLSQTKIEEVIADQWYPVTLHVIDRSIYTEENGVQVAHKPWAEGVCVATCTPILGSLAWTYCAEYNHRTPGVDYVEAEDYILIKEYSENDPVTEFTASQAMVVPVISNVEQIYTINCSLVVA